MNRLIILILIALVVISLLCYKHFFIKEYMNNYKDNPTHILLKNKKNNNNITNTIKKKQNNSTTTDNVVDNVADNVADTATDEDIGLIIRSISQNKLKKDISIESLLE
jgi:hypothetical protein